METDLWAWKSKNNPIELHLKLERPETPCGNGSWTLLNSYQAKTNLCRPWRMLNTKHKNLSSTGTATSGLYRERTSPLFSSRKIPKGCNASWHIVHHLDWSLALRMVWLDVGSITGDLCHRSFWGHDCWTCGLNSLVNVLQNSLVFLIICL